MLIQEVVTSHFVYYVPVSYSCMETVLWCVREGRRTGWVLTEVGMEGKEGEYQDTREFVFVSVVPPGACGIVEVNESDWVVKVFLLVLRFALAVPHYFILPSLASTQCSMKDRVADKKRSNFCQSVKKAGTLIQRRPCAELQMLIHKVTQLNLQWYISKTNGVRSVGCLHILPMKKCIHLHNLFMILSPFLFCFIGLNLGWSVVLFIPVFKVD